MGLPIRRNRLYAVALRRASLVWVGLVEQNVSNHVCSHLRRSVWLEGDVYVGLDEPGARVGMLKEMASLRGVYAQDPETLLACDVSRLLPVSLQPTLDEARSVYSSGRKTGLAGAFVSDLSQSATRLRCGAWLPALARSSILYSHSKEQLFTPGQLEFAMGWPMLNVPGSEEFAKVVGYDFGKLKS